MTVDGKITTRAFSPVDFTSREDKLHLLRQRALGDAVLIGHSTLAHDNVRLGLPDPKMRAEREARGQAPYPIARHRFQRGPDRSRAENFPDRLLAHRHFLDHADAAEISSSRCAKKQRCDLSDARSVDLARMLQSLRSEYGVRRVACEGGAELFRSLLELQLVDRLNLTIAPYIFGGKSAPTLTGRGLRFSAVKRALFVSPNADNWRRVFRRIPAQILVTAAGRGRRTSSPPQFGQILAIASVHSGQKVHS